MASVQKPTIPKGTRDFSPIEMLRRDYIFETIKKVFKLYDYKPIQTPSMENLSTLLGKYGEEGDKLLFKVLNSGDAFSNIEPSELENSKALSVKVCEKGLRYDLTVPFARYVVQHKNEILFPFKRYQIQPVWRADRPQKGRYREFYQCDVDVIGSKSLLNEIELLQIVDRVFEELGIPVVIKINNRKILAAIAQFIGYPDKLIDITVAIDKIEKIGYEEVCNNLKANGIDNEAIKKLHPLLNFKGDSNEKLDLVLNILSDNEIGKTGIEELSFIYNKAKEFGIKQDIEIDFSLARGLNYYTGAIFEVKAKNFSIGSICGGGRYDNLTGIFGMPDISGVGISFGADRIYDVLLATNKFDKSSIEGYNILISNMDESCLSYSMAVASKLRDNDLSCQIYPEQTKLRRQFEFADKNSIEYFIIIGEEERKGNKINIKKLSTGEQYEVPFDKIIGFFKEKF